MICRKFNSAEKELKQLARELHLLDSLSETKTTLEKKAKEFLERAWTCWNDAVEQLSHISWAEFEDDTKSEPVNKLIHEARVKLSAAKALLCTAKPT
jgi:hypothetical protein